MCGVRTIRQLVSSVFSPPGRGTTVTTVPREAEVDHSLDDARLNLVVETARAAVAQEFQIAERLDAKARNQVAVGGTQYALVQAVASIAIKEYLDSSGSTSLFAAALTLGIASGVCLVISILLCYGVWRLRDEQEINADGLTAMAASARDPKVDMYELTIRHYGSILWHRRANNRDRAKQLARSVPLWISSLLLGVTELAIAVALLAAA